MSVHIWIDKMDAWPVYEVTRTDNPNPGFGSAILSDEEWERYSAFSKEAQYWHSKLAELHSESKRRDD